jgi:uracil-DNA glycosylase
MIKKWDELKYWTSGEWQCVQGKLDDLEKNGHVYHPTRELLFNALDSTPFETVRVAIIGQDPYPNPGFSTGIAFSVPRSIIKLPPTLVNIFRVYKSDLGYTQPTRGNLDKWAERGVLLWNAVPSCTQFKSLSHDWEEWAWLTREIVESLSEKGIVFVFLGGVARRYVKFVNPDTNGIIETSHPSPRGSLARPGHNSAWIPFLASRLFSTINAKLVEEGMEPIDWRLQ